MTTPFYIKDCALAVMATGEAAESLIQFREALIKVPLSSIYYHFWGGRLRSTFTHPEFHNDFAMWAHMHLRDDVLSEKLGILDPIDYPNLEDLRRTIIELVEERLEEVEYILWSKRDTLFHFLHSTIIIFDTHIQALHPSDLKSIIPNLTASSIFYHFIDARTRSPNGMDDFSTWLTHFKEDFPELLAKVEEIDPFFLTPAEIRQKLSELINEHFK